MEVIGNVFSKRLNTKTLDEGQTIKLVKSYLNVKMGPLFDQEGNEVPGVREEKSRDMERTEIEGVVCKVSPKELGVAIISKQGDVQVKFIDVSMIEDARNGNDIVEPTEPGTSVYSIVSLEF